MDNVKYLFIPESDIPDYIMVGSISRMRSDKMLKYVPERTCTFSKPEKGSINYPMCSLCGYEADWHECKWHMDGTFVYEKQFCSNCGAKAVD